MNIENIQQLGLMGYPLVLASIATVALILERFFYFLKVSLFSKNTYNSFSLLLDRHAHFDKPIRDEVVELKLENLKIEYFKGIKTLKLLAVVSPLLGLLGTILGIIAAFRVIAAHTTHVSPNMIADGLWEAMLTTAVGLLIAIPAVLCAHFFSSVAIGKLQKLASTLNKLSLDIELKKSPPAYIAND